MFYFRYLFSELRRRKGRTVLTSLGLAFGVGLVVTVSALSSGLDDAQSKVLDPLTGVGTDMSVSRPIQSGSDANAGPASLSKKEDRGQGPHERRGQAGWSRRVHHRNRHGRSLA